MKLSPDMMNTLGLAKKGLETVAVAAIATVGAIAAITKSTIETTGEQARMGATLGITTESMQALDYAAQASHINIELLHNSLAKMGTAVGEAQQGNEKMIGTFAKLGISAKELKSTPLDQTFSKVATSISKLDNQADKIDLTRQIFGKGSASLVPLLDQGAAGIQKFSEEAKRMGLVMSPEQNTNILKAEEGIKKMELGMQGLGNSIASGVVPYLVVALDYVNKWIQSGEAMRTLSTIWEGLKAFIMSIVDSLMKVYQVTKIISRFTNPLEWLQGSSHTITSVQNDWKDLKDMIAKPPSEQLDDWMDGVNKKATKVTANLVKIPTEAEKAVSQATGALGGLLEDLDKKIAQFGKGKGFSSDFSKIMDLKAQGADPKMIDKALAASRTSHLQEVSKSIFDANPINKFKEQMKDVKEIASRMAPEQGFKFMAEQSVKIKDELRSALGIKLNPLEEAERSVAKIKDALKKGLIDPALAARSFREIHDQLLSGAGVKKTTGEEYQDKLRKIQESAGGLSAKEMARGAKEAKKELNASLGIEQSPLEQMQETMAKLKEEFAAGNINRQEFVRGSLAAQEKGEGPYKAGAGGALEAGSKEAYSFMLQAQGQGQNVAQKQFMAQLEANKILLTIAGKPAVELEEVAIP